MKKTMKMVSMIVIMCAAVALFGQTAHAAVHTDDVLAQSTDTYYPTFEGQEQAIVQVRGDGDTVLVLSVYDENGNPIGRDTCRYGDCTVSWVPRWTGSFRVSITNLGYVYNQYTVRTA